MEPAAMTEFGAIAILVVGFCLVVLLVMAILMPVFVFMISNNVREIRDLLKEIRRENAEKDQAESKTCRVEGAEEGGAGPGRDIS